MTHDPTTDSPSPERDEHKDYDVVSRRTITKMVEVYTYECGCVKRAYQALAFAEKNLEEVFGKEYSDFSTMPDQAWHSEDLNTILHKLKCNAWRAIINRLQIRRIMSNKAWKELDEKLDDHKRVPALTVQNIADLLSTYQQKAGKFLEEAILEVYDALRPHDGYRGSRYKTNQKNARAEIGKQIILASMIHEYQAGFNVNSRDEQTLVSLDLVFANLDGFNVPEGYRSPLVDAIQTTWKQEEERKTAETDYFKTKLYKNGNIHLEFKRLDLLAKFNAVAGGNNLKPHH